MVIVHIDGGIGNQLFQCSLALYLKQRLNTEVKLDISYFKEPRFQSYEATYILDEFDTGLETVTSDEYKFSAQENAVYYQNRRLDIVRESRSSFIPEILYCPDNVFVIGYFQSYKYFESIPEIIRQAFIFRKGFHKTSQFWKDKIESAECAVSLHIRRSSYMRPGFRKHSGIISLNYYKDCVNEIKRFYPNITVFVFTHELDWARQNLQLEVPTEFVEGCERDVEELYLMSLCKHNIIANSTFSFWGAYLNQNPNKIVCAPEPWHLDHFGGNTVTPQEWRKMPSKFIVTEPVVSIVVFIKNNSDTVNIALDTVFSQNFMDYEIIIVSAVEDESGNFARNYANRLNVTMLNVMPETSKEAAWNLGLKCSRGEYVMFLTGKNLITPNVITMVCDCWDFSSANNLSRDNYLTTKNRENFTPNIIWSSKQLEENSAGDITVSAVKNKKFILKDVLENQKISDRFLTLSTTNPENLASLFSASLKNSIGSQIFKRAFLEKNNLQFNENSIDSEQMFLVDALLLSEKFIFATELFFIKLL